MPKWPAYVMLGIMAMCTYPVVTAATTPAATAQTALTTPASTKPAPAAPALGAITATARQTVVRFAQ